MSKHPRLERLWLAHYIYGDGARARSAWVLVRDPFAGRQRVYTVYRIALAGDKAATVIGRELDLPLARKVVQKDMEVIR